jgi:Ca2+-binding RTX toxin-like protein
MHGGLDADEMIGGPGNDVLQGGDSDDLLDGADGNDDLIGNTGQDTLKGGTGADVLNGAAGADVLEGGAGADRFRFHLLDGELDEIADFQLGVGGDVLAIGDLLTGFAPGNEADFVQLFDNRYDRLGRPERRHGRQRLHPGGASRRRDGQQPRQPGRRRQPRPRHELAVEPQ